MEPSRTPGRRHHTNSVISTNGCSVNFSILSSTVQTKRADNKRSAESQAEKDQIYVDNYGRSIGDVLRRMVLVIVVYKDIPRRRRCWLLETIE